jgi:branched-chain amino acid aminotransferase
MNLAPISVTKTTQPLQKPDATNLGFGQYFTDHMFVAKYSDAKGWYESKIVPYGPLPMDPAASVLHYGQALFEGMKAFRQTNGDVALFRMEYNWHRMCQGAERLCMVAPPKELFLEGIRQLVKTDQDWIPESKGSALYIRPTLIGTEGFLGVRPSREYTYFIILSPVGSYYKSGLSPVGIWVEEDFTRACPGGLGATKAAANYASSLKAAYEAKKKDYPQVLWLDTTRTYVEEVGTMNVFFVFKNEIVTPSLEGTILAGGTRDSVIKLLKLWGKPVVERKVKLSEIREGAESGNLMEAFGTGTAAVITPVGELAAKNWQVKINDGKMGELTTKLYQDLTDIQYGNKPDSLNWIEKLK